jgi:hypothetical protein
MLMEFLLQFLIGTNFETIVGLGASWPITNFEHEVQNVAPIWHRIGFRILNNYIKVDAWYGLDNFREN